MSPTPADEPAYEPITRIRPLQWWFDRSTRTKVLALVAFSTLVSVLVGVLGLQGLSTTAAHTERLYQENLLRIAAAGDMRAAIVDVQVLTRDALVAGSPGGAQAVLETVPAVQAAFGEAVSAYAAGGLPEEELSRMAAELRTTVTSFVR
jgi:hypothetical protein